VELVELQKYLGYKLRDAGDTVPKSIRKRLVNVNSCENSNWLGYLYFVDEREDLHKLEECADSLGHDELILYTRVVPTSQEELQKLKEKMGLSDDN
jgi:hypothetical protein